MKKVRALFDFIKFPVPVKIAFYYNVVEKLTGNALFPAPDVPLARAKAVTDALHVAYLASKDGSHTAVSAMYDARKIADKAFHSMAAYVSRIADGDETAILSAGFHTLKQPSSIQKPPLSVRNGETSGSVVLVAKAVNTARAYIWQVAKDKLPATESEWCIIGHSTQINFKMANLEITCWYYFRVAAITPSGTTDYTPAVKKLVV